MVQANREKLGGSNVGPRHGLQTVSACGGLRTCSCLLCKTKTVRLRRCLSIAHTASPRLSMHSVASADSSAARHRLAVSATQHASPASLLLRFPLPSLHIHLSSAWAPATASRQRSLSKPFTSLFTTQSDTPRPSTQHSNPFSKLRGIRTLPPSADCELKQHEDAPQQQQGEAERPQAPRLDRKDFIVSKRCDETIVRLPGQLCGQSFMVEECKGCDVYLLDHSAAVTVDLCEGCRFFIGPCESSVFLRDCSRCVVVVAAQQLRLRDCHDLQLLLYVSASQPVIESSHSLQLSCFPLSPSYPQLAAQFASARLHPFNSQWSNVHDFHAPADGDRHWSFLPFGTVGRQLGMKGVGEASGGRVDEQDEEVVPETWGERPLGPGGERLLLLVRDGQLGGKGMQTAYELVKKTRRTEGGDDALRLLRTRCVKLTEERARAVAGHDGLGGESVIALEYRGRQQRQFIAELISARGWTQQQVILVEAERTADGIETVFEAAAQV